MAESYLSYVGTDKLSNEEINQRFYKLACNYDISVDGNSIDITLTGLSSFMNDAVEALRAGAYAGEG